MSREQQYRVVYTYVDLVAVARLEQSRESVALAAFQQGPLVLEDLPEKDEPILELLFRLSKHRQPQAEPRSNIRTRSGFNAFSKASNNLSKALCFHNSLLSDSGGAKAAYSWYDT